MRKFELMEWRSSRFKEIPIRYTFTWVFISGLYVLIQLEWIGALIVVAGILGLGIWLGRML